MTVEDVIREMCFRSRRSMRAVSLEMGRSGAFLSTTLAKGSIPGVDTMARIAGVCGYRLLFVPASEAIPPGALELSDV